MNRSEAYDAWKTKINEPASKNTFLNCAEDKESGLYWIQYKSDERFEFKYEPLARSCPTCGAEMDGECSRCTSCQLMINIKCGM